MNFHINWKSLHSINEFFTIVHSHRKRSVSVSSRSSSVESVDLPKRRKKSGRRKLDEVERLAEMERQRRQKEVEQKVMHGSVWLPFRYKFRIWFLIELFTLEAIKHAAVIYKTIGCYLAINKIHNNLSQSKYKLCDCIHWINSIN